MKNNSTLKEETLFVMHTSTPINNSKIHKKILCKKNARQVNNLVSKYGDKVKQIHVHGKIENLKYFNNHFHGVVKVFARNKEEVIKNSKLLLEKKCYICPEFPVENLVDISFITSMKIAVDLLYRIDHMGKDTVLNILNHYLHHASLAAPVEPFHSILMSRLKERKISIWSLHQLSPGQLNGYFESIPQEHPVCMSCIHFPFCFAWAKYEKDTCNLWQSILDCLQRNAKQIKGYLRRLQTKRAPSRDTKNGT